MELNEKEKSELAKINELSSNKAAEALSQMVNKKVKVNFPNLTLEPLEEMKRLNENMIISICEISGDMTGNILMAFVKEKGLSLLEAMMMHDNGSLKTMTDEAKEAFNELNNIVGGAYLSALANSLSFKIFPEPPKFIGDMKIIQNELMGELKENVDNILLVNTELGIESTDADGMFFMILDKQSLDKMLNMLNKK